MLLLGKIHNSGMNETLDTLVAQKWNVSRRNLPRCLFQPLHSPFLSVFSPLKGLILCTQTSRVEGHHQVTPTRPTTHCHFAVLPETLALSTLETWLLNFSEPSSTPDPPDILAKILIYNETVALLRDICATREIVLQWNFHWNFYRFFLVFGFWFLFFFFFLDLPNVLHAAWIIITWNSWLEEFRVNFFFDRVCVVVGVVGKSSELFQILKFRAQCRVIRGMIKIGRHKSLTGVGKKY